MYHPRVIQGQRVDSNRPGPGVYPAMHDQAWKIQSCFRIRQSTHCTARTQRTLLVATVQLSTVAKLARTGLRPIKTVPGVNKPAASHFRSHPSFYFSFPSLPNYFTNLPAVFVARHRPAILMRYSSTTPYLESSQGHSSKVSPSRPRLPRHTMYTTLHTELW